MSSIEMGKSKADSTVFQKFDQNADPVILTPLEEPAVNSIMSILRSNGISLEMLHLERKTDEYLTFVFEDFEDFLRMKWTDQAKWISVSLSIEGRNFYKHDARFSQVSSKEHRYWKTPLQNTDELNNCEDVIIDAARQAINNTKVPDDFI